MDNLIKLATDYALEVSPEHLLYVMEQDFKRGMGEYDLAARLGKVKGVSRVDYTGHFGPYIYYSVSHEHDNAETHLEVKDLVYNFYNR